jgi:DNA-binding NarL/FixJ family response regulator
MAENELNVKDINEVKRLWQLGIANRQIARALKIHRNTVNKYVEQFKSEILGLESQSSVVDELPVRM